MALSPGTRFGPYEIQSRIGSGGMGEVYKARDTRLDRDVAIKVIAEGLSTDRLARERFAQEALAVARLDHPHICPLYDVGRDNGVDFLVMALIDGQSLGERLRKGAIPLREALRYGIQIADALDKAHRAGIVHRDLKPGNVILARDGVKLLDFGLATSAARPGEEPGSLSGASTTRRVIVGTPRYMAPEQIVGLPSDGRTDVFAFGELVFEMITATRAYRTNAYGTSVFDREPPLLSAFVRDTPPALARTIAKCLKTDPDQRWQSAGDLLDELRWIEASWSASMPVATSARSGRRRMALAALTAAAVGAAAVAFVQFARRPSPPAVVRFAINPEPGVRFGDFAVSPDGQRLAFVQTIDRRTRLWLRSLAVTEAQPLAGTDEAHDPFWSPDGQSIGFFADGKLKRLALGSGVVQAVCDAPDARGGSWNAGGVIVFAPNIGGPLFKVAANGGTPSPATTLDDSRQEDSHRKPVFLPDGRHFLFIARSHKQDRSGVDVGAIDSADRVRLLNVESATAFVDPGVVLYLREGTQGALMAMPFDAARLRIRGEPFAADERLPSDLVGFSASPSGVLAYAAAPPERFVWFDRQGREQGTVTPPGRYAGVALSADGGRAVVHRVFQGNHDLWVLDLVRGTTSRLTSDPAVEDDPVWSPDGERIAFSSTRGTTSNIYVTAAAGAGAEEPLLTNEHSKAPADWSLDNRFLLFTQYDAATLNDIWALPLVGDRRPFPVVRTQFTEAQPRLSADGRWMAYESNETGSWEVYLRGFPTSTARWRVSTAGGAQPQWRRDGRELFYVNAQSQMMAVAMTPSETTMAFGDPRPLFQTGIADYAMPARYAVAPDAQRFLINVHAEDETSKGITLSTNWHPGIGRQP